MLVELVVRGLGVIDATELSLERGSSALTGETGAGKTLLVAALDLLLGGKADRALVRDRAPEARVEGRFILPPGHPGRTLLAEHDLLEETSEAEEAEVVIARTITADGRSKARVNGRLTPLWVLSELGGGLVEIAGQQEHARVTSAAVQRALLDAYAGEECLRLAADVAAAVAEANRAGRAADRVAAEAGARDRELDAISAEIAEIEAAHPHPGETEALAAAAARLEHAEVIGTAVAAALEALRAERGALDLLDAAASEVGRLTDVDASLGALAERLRNASYEIDDVALELAHRVPPAEPHALEEVRARLAQLRRLHRRYGDGDADVLGYLEQARHRRAALETAGDESARWQSQRAAALERAREITGRLSARRAEAAPRLARALERTLAELALPEATFEIRLEPRPLHEGGAESVAFLVAADPGQPPRPLAKVASGGELSRITLALHLLSAAGGPGTMVFDEVDAGVGGEAAQAVGRSLARLAATSARQVLVVTHLPQVAAFADAHYRVTKSTSRGRTVAVVARVEAEERVAELSRMLAGLPGSKRARSHARELLEVAASGQ